MKSQARPNVIILHGTSSTPESHWLPWLARELKAEGFDVFAPAMPEADRADLSVWTPFIFEHAHFNERTIMVGHSAGCPLILNILQNLDQGERIAAAFLVGGFAAPLAEMPPDHQTLLKNPDWKRMQAACAHFCFMNSDNDPWGCDHIQGEYMRQHLGGMLVVPTGEGHFGSARFEQVYTEFPLLKMLIMLQAKKT